MKKWKIKLSCSLDKSEVKHCVEAANMDLAIAEAFKLSSIPEDIQRYFTKSAQTFSDVENSDPLEAERIFLETGNFNAYLQLMGKA